MIPGKHFSFFLVFFAFFTAGGFAQNSGRLTTEQCGTMPHLQQLLDQNPALKERFEAQRKTFARLLTQRTLSQNNTLRTEATIYIPVVIHVVLPNPAVVTVAQILAQLDT